MTTANLYLRDLPSCPFHYQRLTKKWRRFFDAKIIDRLSLPGYKLANKAELASHMVNLLIKTGLANQCVGDSRDGNRPEARLRVKVWDSIRDAGLAVMCRGSETSAKVSRYQATSKLLNLRKRWSLRLLENTHLDRSAKLLHPSRFSLVVLLPNKIKAATGKPTRGARRTPLSLRKLIEQTAQRGDDGIEADPRAIANGLEWWADYEDQMDRINRSNLSFTWITETRNPETGKRRARPVNPCLRMVHVGELYRAMRLYSFGSLSGQNLSKEERAAMLIGGEPSVTLDFSCMALRLLYQIRGHHNPDPSEDLYRPGRVFRKFYSRSGTTDSKKDKLRKFVKKATNICLNVASRQKADAAVRNLLRKSEDADFLQQSVYEVEEITPKRIVSRIIKAHPAVKDHFFKEIGLELMTRDGKIMFNILRQFADAKKPALGIHDAVVCRASDAKFTRNAMTTAYRLYTMGYDPVIH